MKRRSIRTRITLIFIGIMAGVLLSVWIINNWWLEKYYTTQKLQVLEDAYEEIDREVMERVSAGEEIEDVIDRELKREWEIWRELARSGAGPRSRSRSRYPQESESQTDVSGLEAGERDGRESDGRDIQPRNNDEAFDESIQKELEGTLAGTIRAYSEKNNITIVLINSDTGKALLNLGRENDFLVQKVQRYILGIEDDLSESLIVHENYVIEKNQDPRSNASYLECWGFFSDNSTMFLMQMPLAGIRDSVALSNRFTTFVGLVALVAGSIMMYFATKRVTGPLMKLAALSERMSNLDFDVHYQDDEQDEIGVLGRSMNTLSEKLKETIGELKEANQQLQHDIEEKIQIDEMRKDFIANVSHELKTPIALIQGYAEGLAEGLADDPESRDYYCEVIMDESKKMNKMVKQLLTLTALEFGNDSPAMEEFDIVELIGDLVSSTRILLQQNQAEVVWEQTEPILVLADEFKIEEVLTNYLNNAMNHLGGQRQIRIRAKQEGSKVTVSVFNNGTPIPEEDLPNLWIKFYKVDKARTRAYGGSGIGLSIVKAITDAHHQECGVNNADDGVEFWFTMQAAREQSVHPRLHLDNR